MPQLFFDHSILPFEDVDFFVSLSKRMGERASDLDCGLHVWQWKADGLSSEQGASLGYKVSACQSCEKTGRPFWDWLRSNATDYGSLLRSECSSHPDGPNHVAEATPSSRDRQQEQGKKKSGCRPDPAHRPAAEPGSWGVA